MNNPSSVEYPPLAEAQMADTLIIELGMLATTSEVAPDLALGGSRFEPGAEVNSPLTEAEIAEFVTGLDALGDLTEAPENSILSEKDRRSGLSDAMFINTAQAEANAQAQYNFALMERRRREEERRYFAELKEQGDDSDTPADELAARRRTRTTTSRPSSHRGSRPAPRSNSSDRLAA